MKTSNKTMISLELPDDLKQTLQSEASEKEMSTSALIRYIIKQYYVKTKIGDSYGNSDK